VKKVALLTNPRVASLAQTAAPSFKGEPIIYVDTDKLIDELADIAVGIERTLITGQYGAAGSLITDAENAVNRADYNIKHHQEKVNNLSRATGLLHRRLGEYREILDSPMPATI
jgi:hypothetical protein